MGKPVRMELAGKSVMLFASPELIAQMREWSGPFEARIVGPDRHGIWDMELRTSSPMPVDNPVDNSRSSRSESYPQPVDKELAKAPGVAECDGSCTMFDHTARAGFSTARKGQTW